MSSELGEKIRTARKEKGISQQDLASHLGISRATLSKYESGIHQPSALVLMELENILDLDDLQDELPLQNRLVLVREKKPTYAEDAVTSIIEQVLKDRIDSINLTTGQSDPKLLELQSAFNKLNDLGKDTAIQRILELTEIPRYQRDSEE